MATVIQVEKPKETWEEIRELIDAHYHAPGNPEPFMKIYPETYHLYLQISAHKEEFGLGVSS